MIEKAGKRYAAHEEYIEVEVRADGVYSEGVKIPGAVSNNKLKLTFAKGAADNPIVQGIIVYADAIESILLFIKILPNQSSITSEKHGKNRKNFKRQ